jgi:hypothetical protein
LLAGHIGAALVGKKVEPRLNLGLLLLAALLADVLLWVLVLAGAERVVPPEASGAARFFTFVFPYSHGLVATAGWAAAAALAIGTMRSGSPQERVRVSRIIALVVLSHFLLDWVVHVPDLPILATTSPRLGLGLWRHMPLALAVELALASAGLWLYLRALRPPRGRAMTVSAIVLGTGGLTALGPYAPGPPPSPSAIASSSLALLLLVVAAGFVAERIGRRPPVCGPAPAVR